MPNYLTWCQACKPNYLQISIHPCSLKVQLWLYLQSSETSCINAVHPLTTEPWAPLISKVSMLSISNYITKSGIHFYKTNIPQKQPFSPLLVPDILWSRKLMCYLSVITVYFFVAREDTKLLSSVFHLQIKSNLLKLRFKKNMTALYIQMPAFSYTENRSVTLGFGIVLNWLMRGETFIKYISQKRQSPHGHQRTPSMQQKYYILLRTKLHANVNNFHI